MYECLTKLSKKQKLDLLFEYIRTQVHRGELLHPVFAEGPYQALGYLEEELGEVAKEVMKKKDGWESRMNDELVDLVVVAIRMLRGDWKNDLSEGHEGNM